MSLPFLIAIALPLHSQNAAPIDMTTDPVEASRYREIVRNTPTLDFNGILTQPSPTKILPAWAFENGSAGLQLATLSGFDVLEIAIPGRSPTSGRLGNSDLFHTTICCDPIWDFKPQSRPDTIGPGRLTTGNKPPPILLQGFLVGIAILSIEQSHPPARTRKSNFDW
jgi:hypothetical protein